MNNFRKRAVGGVMVVALAGACAPSTQYQPKNRERAHLAVVAGYLAIGKQGSATAQGPIDQLVACDETARRFAVDAHQLRREADDLVMAANVLDAALGPLLLGVVLRSVAAGKASSSNAALIDAINRHNDAATCRSTPVSPSPVAALEVR